MLEAVQGGNALGAALKAAVAHRGGLVRLEQAPGRDVHVAELAGLAPSADKEGPGLDDAPAEAVPTMTDTEERAGLSWPKWTRCAYRAAALASLQ